MAAIRAISRSRLQNFTSSILQNLSYMRGEQHNPIPASQPQIPSLDLYAPNNALVFVGSGLRRFHDGRPRGPLWRGKKLIGKEALFVIQGLKRFKDDEEKLGKFIKTHVLRLLKMDLIAVISELERQDDVSLAAKIFEVIRKQDWYKPDMYLYKDLIISLTRGGKMEEAMRLWESMRSEGSFPDSQLYTEVIRGYLKDGSPADAMNIYEDMKNSPDPPEELPFRILLKGLLPHPLLRNKVKQDYEELFPEKHIYDPPEEIFGVR